MMMMVMADGRLGCFPQLLAGAYIEPKGLSVWENRLKYRLIGRPSK